jgi:hypothetical protein
VVDDTELQTYKARVTDVLGRILGESGAKAILFYVGDPSPETFGVKLRSILGDGANLILQELDREEKEHPSQHKRRWLRAVSRSGWSGAGRGANLILASVLSLAAPPITR